MTEETKDKQTDQDTKQDTKQESKDEQKEEKQQPKKQSKKSEAKPFVHINTYIDEASDIYGLSSIQQSGFIAHMQGKQYLPSIEDFDKALQNYLGK